MRKTIQEFEPRIIEWEARYTSASEHVERLTPSLLAKAIRGVLVGEDTIDVSTSALLEKRKLLYA